MQRHNTVDIVRFLGAFFVVLIHLGFTTPPWEAQIRLLGRFAVPFFFMVSGYFFQKKLHSSGVSAFSSTVFNILAICVVANLVYLPFAMWVMYTKGKPIISVFSSTVIALGIWQHLWFLTSMIVGYLILWWLYVQKFWKYLPILSILLVILMLLSESYAFLGYGIDMPLVRTFLSVPLIYIGFLFAEYETGHTQSVWLLSGILVLTIGSQVAESLALYYYFHQPIGRLQFFISTPFFAAAVLLLALRIQTAPTLFSEWGRKYSLLIYLYHILVVNLAPYYYAILPKSLKYLKYGGPLLAFSITLGVIILTERFAPKVFHILSGKVS